MEEESISQEEKSLSQEAIETAKLMISKAKSTDIADNALMWTQAAANLFWLTNDR